MNVFTVPQGLANKLESETRHLLDNNIPAWKLLTGMHNYSDYRQFEHFENRELILKQPLCFFNPVYYYIRDYKTFGMFEDMFKDKVPNIPSLVELVNYLRDTYLDQSYYLYRLYVNLLPKAPKALFPPHVDMIGENNYTFLYYVIDSDGDTLIYDSKTCRVINSATPIKGTGIYFPSSTIHAASTPINNNIRIVANVIFCKNIYARSN